MDLLWNVNVRSALLATAAALPAMLAAGRGLDHLDQLDLGPARRASPGPLRGDQGGPRRDDPRPGHGVRAAGLRANAVAPGVVETDMWPVLADPAVAAEVIQHIPTRRTSTPEEVADTVVFLASDASRAITGEILSADGGIHSTVNLWPGV